MSKFQIIPAADAYAYASCGQSIDDVLEKLDTQIRIAASEGKTSIRVPYELCRRVTNYEFVLHSKELADILSESGYKLISRYEDGSFLSDIWLELSWHPNAK